MLSRSKFAALVKSELDIDILAREEKKTKGRAVLAGKGQSLFLVAGPGTGKTTALALRVLKLLLVDEIEPNKILATTFTRKAAAELSSRILGWGDRLRRAALGSLEHGQGALQNLDFGRLRIGTLDSLAEDILTEYRPASANAPTVIEDYARRALTLRSGLFEDGRLRSTSLETLIREFKGPRLNVGRKVDFLCTLRDRLAQDLVNEVRLKKAAKSRQKQDFHRGILRALAAVESYVSELRDREVMDFADLEVRFLEQVQNEILRDFVDDLTFVFVDEYQDTNPLQERIYFALARTALSKGGSICVVGDDDQALYRFRGATVELFSQFESRFRRAMSHRPEVKKVFLNHNYRSTEPVVTFVNAFINLDGAYKSARVIGKPALVQGRRGPMQQVPILGIFRPDARQLAEAIANFVDRLVNRGGKTITDGHHKWTIQLDRKGSANDLAFLASSVREEREDGEPRLPALLRDALGALKNPIEVFNPRGQALTAVEDVQRLLGLMLECIDGGSNIQGDINWLKSLAPVLDSWRTLARTFTKRHPDRDLKRFIEHWAERKPFGRRATKLERVSLNDLAYKLVTWLPIFLDDIERLVQLEAISRTIADSALFSSFSGEILFTPNKPTDKLGVASVKAALQDVFAPLASGSIDLNEDLLETLPRDRLSLMTVHQAKGLEFPVVIVDVGSDFRSRSSAKFRRFPTEGGETQAFEDFLSPYMAVSPFHRKGRDRAFDDLIRQFFVAFSRAQDVLILVGLDSVRNGYTVKSGSREIENVATGWSRDGKWHWGRGLRNLVHI